MDILISLSRIRGGDPERLIDMVNSSLVYPAYAGVIPYHLTYHNTI